MKPNAHGRVCRECGDRSRVGKRVGGSGYCRWCFEALPESEKRKLRILWAERDRMRRAS